MQFKLIKKVPVVEINGKTCFLDTGRDCTVVPVESDYIRDFFGIHSLYVAGTKSLKRYTKFDYPNNEITTSDDPIPLEGGITVPLVSRGGWLVKMTIDGVEGLRYIDTGAAYSYVHHIQPSLPVVEIADECGWFRGRFTAHVHRVPCEFAGHSFDILCGDVKDNPEYVPPEGVIGYDFFANFTIVIDRVGGKMTFVRLSPQWNCRGR